MDDLDDLLAGREAGNDLLADRLLPHARDELAHDAEAHIGFQEGQPDFAASGGHLLLGEPPLSAKAPQYGLQLAR